MKKIERVAVIIPVAKEPQDMIIKRSEEMKAVRETMGRRGIIADHFWLDDAAANLPADARRLITHDKNVGLAETLGEGYDRLTSILPQTYDAVVRLDAQEHNLFSIPEAIEQLRCTDARAVYVPIIYCRDGEPRRLAIEATAIINHMVAALKPLDAGVVGGIYNQVFPLGFQVYEMSLLREILPDFWRVTKMFHEKFGQRATWGMDLVALVLAAQRAPIDLIFRDYTEPWTSNRLEGHVTNQHDRVIKMLSVLTENAAALGLVLAEKA